MLRVIQWATGSVGRHAVAAVHGHPDLELVGALVYSNAKAGRDIGDACGIGAIGVTATKNPDEIVALDADCVLYMPQGEMNPLSTHQLAAGSGVDGLRHLRQRRHPLRHFGAAPTNPSPWPTPHSPASHSARR
jgi:hypothetical protein